MASELWQRSLRSRRRLIEVTLMLRKPADEVSVFSAVGDVELEVAVASIGIKNN